MVAATRAILRGRVSARPRPHAMHALMLQLLAVAAFAVTVAKSEDKLPTKPPHLVFFLADDQGNHDIGFHSANITSPHIDALQKAGRELKRHYVFKYCSPTRAALLSGRLPYHAHQWNLDAGRPGGTNLAFTLMPAMLKKFGYAPHLVGKWHGGMSRHAFLPSSRGFISSIGVLSGGHDHITQRNPGQGCSAWSPTIPSGPCQPLPLPPDNNKEERAAAGKNDCAGGVVDYWQSERTGSPGEGGCTATACPVPNGTFEPYSLNARALSIVAAHDPSRPLYLHYTPHMIHTPLERSPTMPSEFVNGSQCGCDERCTLQSMVNVLDSLVANLTAALKEKGMMKNLVFVYSADNGGGALIGSNYPYKGGKTNFYEGGIRAAAFVYSELLPPAVRGVPITGPVHICDWWKTFCGLAGGKGAECEDNNPSAHPLDSLNLWDLIVGENATSPREGHPLVIGFQSDGKYSPTALNQSQCGKNKKDDCCQTGSCDSARGSGTGALIWGDYKLIVGKQTHNWHTPPDFPCRNTSMQAVDADDCEHRCLYNLALDAVERRNLITSSAAADKAALHRLSTYYESLGDACAAHTTAGATACKAAGCGWDAIADQCRVYNLPDLPADDPKACAAINKRGGYWGPWDD